MRDAADQSTDSHADPNTGYRYGTREFKDKDTLLATKDDILWVLGMRTDGRFLPGPETKKVLVVSIRSSGAKR